MSRCPFWKKTSSENHATDENLRRRSLETYFREKICSSDETFWKKVKSYRINLNRFLRNLSPSFISIFRVTSCYKRRALKRVRVKFVFQGEISLALNPVQAWLRRRKVIAGLKVFLPMKNHETK